MKYKIVKASQLKDDWRPERFFKPSPEEIQKAKLAGWECGAKGLEGFSSKWMKHGNTTIRREFISAVFEGRIARRKFLEPKC